MVPNFYTNFALVMTLISSVSSEDFCDAFVRNKGSISYILRERSPKEGEVTNYLIINGTYWSSTLDVKETPTMKLDTTHSKSCSLFTDKYYAIEWIPFRINGKDNCAILFWEKLWPNVTIGCHKGEGDPNDLENYLKVVSIPLNGVDPKETQKKIVFMSDSKDTDIDLVFVTQKSLGQSLSVNKFRVEYNGQQLMASPKSLDDDLESLQNFKPNMRLIGASLQWSSDHKISRQLIFFKDDLKIKWCATQPKDLMNECQTKASVLIDCNPNTGSSATPEESKPYLWIVVIIVVTIIVIAVIVCLYCYSKSKTDLKTNQKSEKSSQKSSESGAQKRSSIVGTSSSTNFGPKK